MRLDADLDERSVEAYEEAYARVVQARQEWEAAGRPFVLEQRNRMVGAHPLWKVLREAEADAAKRLERARVRRPGRTPVAVVQAEIGASRAEKLRLLAGRSERMQRPSA